MSRILIIEDEEAIADLERDYLELSGFDVEIEHRGDVGLKRALTEDFNLVILDLMLPEMNGFDICREIRAQKNTPIIMVSAKKDDIDKIRGLGLSNFLPHHIKNILENGTVKPVVNQLELHPGYMQQAAVQYCKEHGIQMQAWSPIGRRRILEDGLILELAGKYQVSPAQLCLRFLLQNDIIPLPKSSSMERMKQNMDLFHFEISEEDVSRLATMPQAGWSGEHPDPELAQKNVV